MSLIKCTIILALVAARAAMAADFELFWDPNCNADTDLEGYYVYYKQNASVIADPGGAIDLYVALTNIDFDQDNPSLLIPNLFDDERYCFAITAWYGNEESDMSNEVCGINGVGIALATGKSLMNQTGRPVSSIQTGTAAVFNK